MIDWVIAMDAKVNRRSLSVASIDYRKAYDVVLHKWLRVMLKAVRAPAIVQRAVMKVMKHWVTEIEIRTEGTTVREPARFRRGLFQGDSLSPLLFVLAVAPLSSCMGLAGGVSSPTHGV